MMVTKHIKKTVINALKRTIVTAVVCIGIGSMHAYGQTGITSVPFLRITPDAVSSGMGSAGVTSLRGVNGGWYNPSLLGWQGQPKVGLTHANWLPALNVNYYYDHLSAVIPVEPLAGVLGATVTYFNLGGQIARDAQGYTTGSFANYETAVSVSYGRRVGRQWAVGATGSYIHSSLASGLSVNGFQIRPGRSASLSLGTSWRSLRHTLGEWEGQWRAGASLSHFGMGIKYFDEQTRDPLPMTLRVGLGGDLSGGDHRFTVAADVSKLMARTERQIQAGDTSYVAMGPLKALVNSWGNVRVPGPSGGISELTLTEQLMTGVGVEYGFQELFFARAGYYHEDPANGNRQFLSLGAGVQLAGISVDMSYLSAAAGNPVDGTLRFSVSYNFGGTDRPVSLPKRVPKGVTGNLKSLDMHRDLAEKGIKTKPSVLDSTVARDERTELALSDAAPVTPDSVADDKADQIKTEEGPGEERVTTAEDAQLLDGVASVNIDLSGFPTMSSKLSQRQKDAIARAVILLQKNPGASVHIGGHTDARGSQALNQMLSEARARAIYLEMLSYGVLDWSRLSIQGYGASRPLQAGESVAALRANRRGELSLPAAEGESLWAGKQPPKEVIKLRALDGLPVNGGKEFVFNWLELAPTGQAQQWLASVADYMAAHPQQTLKLAHVVNYSTGSGAFMRELEKARGDLVKDLLIRLGVAHERIEVLKAEDAFWVEHVSSLPLEENSESTWLFITK